MKRIHLLVDNLGVHRTYAVQTAARKANIVLIFNASYSSEVNPIERVWSIAKRSFATKVLSITNFKSESIILQAINESINEVSAKTLELHVRRC